MKNLFKKIDLNVFFKEPIRILIFIYCFIVILGFVILCLPLSQKLSISWIDNLFTSASAVSTTGLTTISVSDKYNFFGQLITLLLIQVGGIHYMAFGSLIILGRRKKLSKIHEDLIKNDFGLPDGFNLTGFISAVVAFSLIIEAVGAAFLYFIFLRHGESHPLWNAIFHSVSAFCTAGFSLFNTSFENYSGDWLLNIVIIVLSVLGACGFIVITDYWQKITGKKKDVTFTTKIIVWFTVLIITIGTLLLFFLHSFNSEPNLANKFWMSIFQAMSALTTVGFDTFPISQMAHSAVYLLAILMVMGASPAGTGGGVKSTTIVAVFSQTINTLRGKSNVTFLNHQIPNYRLRIANANLIFYIFILSIGIYLLSIFESFPIFELMFEAASAMGTVGLSMGITASLSFLGKAIIIGLMILGRIGPLTIGLALFYNKKEPDNLGWYEDIAV